MRKIYGNYAMIVGVNTVLLGLGILGGITPVLSALLHNLTTVGAALYALTLVKDFLVFLRLAKTIKYQM